jgi:hypothetical protein
MIKNCMSTHNVFFSPQKVVTLQKGSTWIHWYMYIIQVWKKKKGESHGLA